MHTTLIGANDPDIRMILQRLFRRAGHPAVTVADSDAILETALETLPQLLVLNVPGQRALDICTALRADPRTTGIRIIVVSTALYPDAATARQAGADDYIPAPFDNADLVNRAQALLNIGSVLNPAS